MAGRQKIGTVVFVRFYTIDIVYYKNEIKILFFEFLIL